MRGLHTYREPVTPVYWQSDSQRYVTLRPQQLPWVRRDTAIEKAVEGPLARNPTPDQVNPEGSGSPSGSECSLDFSATEHSDQAELFGGLAASVNRELFRSASRLEKPKDMSLLYRPCKRQKAEPEQPPDPSDMTFLSSPSRESVHANEPCTKDALPRVEIMSSSVQNARLQRIQPAPLPCRSRSRGTTSTDLSNTLGTEVKLPACPIGAVELLTFFPNHTQWPQAGLRLHANDWTFLEIAAVALHARGSLTSSALHNRRATLRHQVSRNGKDYFRDQDFTLTLWKRKGLLKPHVNYDATRYMPRSNIDARSLRDMSLLACAQGVINWPTGQDCGILTQCIEMARDVGDGALMLSEICRIAEHCGFVQPAEAGTSQWDQLAMKRVSAMLKTYHLDSQLV